MCPAWGIESCPRYSKRHLVGVFFEYLLAILAVEPTTCRLQALQRWSWIPGVPNRHKLEFD